MQTVEIDINGRQYTVQCGDDERERLVSLAAWVDQKVRDTVDELGQIGDSRLLVLTLIRVADEVFDIVDQLDIGALSPEDLRKGRSDTAVAALVRAAERIEALQTSLNTSAKGASAPADD